VNGMDDTLLHEVENHFQYQIYSNSLCG
jgi:hypothetical protein